jgi:hypothetical protein
MLIKIAFFLVVVGAVSWFLVEFAGILFKLLFYGLVTMLGLGWLTWLLVS